MTTWRQPLGEISDDPLVEAFTDSTHWCRFSSRQHRQHMTQHLPPPTLFPSIAIKKWKLFWKQPMDPMARTLWYRLLHGKLMHQRLYAKFSPTSSPSCSFCSAATETLDHLFYRCPAKWSVWQAAFQSIQLDSNVDQETIHDLVTQLSFSSAPSSINLWLLCSCIIQAIWRHHWLHVLHSTPFTTQNVLAFILHLFSRLRPPPLTHIIPSQIDINHIAFSLEL